MGSAWEGQGGLLQREAGPRKSCRMAVQHTGQVERSRARHFRQKDMNKVRKDKKKKKTKPQTHHTVFRELKIFPYC